MSRAQETFRAVEAIMLNTDGDPGEEMQAGIDAVVTFAVVACDATDEAVREMVERAIRRARHALQDG